MNAPSDREYALFDEASELPPAQRPAFLDQACAGDPALRERVDQLLRSHDQVEAFLERPAPRPPATVKLQMPPEEQPGTVIGRYRILEKVGEGGFGIVYVAEQREPVKRRVALKIIKLGMDTRQVVARFEAERQALALMDHPNIAKVLDAGATDTGRPFFVMELVRGIKFTDYCDQNKLPTAQRLQLFVQVCHAIQHAHQKGIIHRDIKPSNILVTLHDGVPVPKVIDFGIAKATQGELTDKTVYTQFQQFIGTPAYISPEQAEMSGLDIDTRSDIYSLGVLLYELLTGRTPFDQQQLLEAGLDGMRKMIREVEPMRPSTRINSLQGVERTTTATRRQIEAPRLIHMLRGDLDWIVMKCLEKDRTRRYETANGLAMDLRRYLGNEPVVARPPSRLYRMQKAVRRNKLAFTAAGITTMALVGGIVFSTVQAIQASRARDAARRAQRQAEEINKFLKDDILLQAAPDRNAPEAMQDMMKAMLDQAALKLDRDPNITAHPEVEATLRLAVGETYRQLGEWPTAETHFRRSVTLRRNALGPDHRETLLAQKDLACLLSFDLNMWREERELLAETETKLKRLVIQSGNRNDTELLRASLMAEAAHIYCLANTGELELAIQRKRTNLVAFQQGLGADDHDSITALSDLGVLFEFQGDFDQAQHAYEEARQRYERIGRGNTYDAFECTQNSAWCRYLLGHAEESETRLNDARVRATKIFGPEHPITLDIQHRLARVLIDQQRWDEAESLARTTLEARRRVLSPKNGRLAYTMAVVGRILVQRNKLDEAEPLLRSAQAIFREYYSNQRRLVATAENWLGAIELARTNYAKAEQLLVPLANEFLLPSIQMSPTERGYCIQHIIDAYEAHGNAKKAAEWRQHLAALATAPATKSTNHQNRVL